MPKRRVTQNWVKAFRKAIKQTCPIGWAVINDRGRVRVQVGKRGAIQSINLPYSWSEEDWIDAYKRIEVAANIYLEHHQNIDIKNAFQIAASASSKVKLNWEEAINEFRSYKTRVKDSTWKSKYKPVFNQVLEALSSKNKPINGLQLCEIALNQWAKGTSQRPMLSDLRETQSLETHSDMVVMMYRDEYYDPDTTERGIAELITCKHRNGPVGTVKLLFEPQFTRFRNLAA